MIMSSEPNSAKCLPDWARQCMDGWRDGSRRSPVPIADELPHRREAFYRLYSADDPDVKAMWAQASKGLKADERKYFIPRLILSTDAIVPDERLPVYKTAPVGESPKYRTREQRAAYKLAVQLQRFAVVTPPRCQAYQARFISVDIEKLIISFNIKPAERDDDERWRSLQIEYTTSSKRGWIQHRRASDKVRREVITTARRLADLPDAKRHQSWLRDLAAELESLPNFETEHSFEFGDAESLEYPSIQSSRDRPWTFRTR